MTDNYNFFFIIPKNKDIAIIPFLFMLATDVMKTGQLRFELVRFLSGEVEWLLLFGRVDDFLEERASLHHLRLPEFVRFRCGSRYYLKRRVATSVGKISSSAKKISFQNRSISSGFEDMVFDGTSRSFTVLPVLDWGMAVYAPPA